MINKEKNEIGLKLFPTCRKCGVKLTNENWYVSFKKIPNYICKKCNYKCTKKWKQNNRDKYNQSQREWQQNNKDKCNQSQRKWQQNNRDKCNQSNKKWQQDNRDKYNQSQRESNQQLRDDVIDAYGGKCACCGEERKEYLSIDHKNGNGKKHRKEIGVTGLQFYRWLRQNNYPDGFQVLCFNCNCGKGTYSVSPHNKEDFEEEFEAKHKTADSKSVWKLRLNVIEGYGGKCELCGEDDPHCLTIDHINEDGAEERKMIGGTYTFYRKLRDNNYPRDNYRLLCYNCNCALGFNRITEEEILQQNKH